MPISDRLDQIEQDAQDAAECWPVGRSKFNTESNAEAIDGALANGEQTLAALRAVLDTCDQIDASLIPNGDFETGQKSVTQTVRMIIERKLSGSPGAQQLAEALAATLDKEDQP